MFEDSLGVATGSRSRVAGWTVPASITVQGLLAMAFLLIPLLRPQTLPLLRTEPKAVSVSILKPVEPVKPRVVTVTNPTMSALSAPAMAQPHAAGMIQRVAADSPDDAPSLNLGVGMSERLSVGTGIGVSSLVASAPLAPVVSGAKSGTPVRVSSGVSTGLLLHPIQPVYPRIAVAARVEGTVIVTATIDKSGRIAGLEVLSGPVMLRQAATDAIREARYRPYLLNGEPTEVITTISVTFRMGG